jgi:hypothetical protein
MADPLVISALMKKRAELDGDVRQAEKRIADLRADLETIDAAIRIFDASRIPHKIKPKVRRAKPRMFRHGECSRAVMGILRVAAEPMTVRAITDRLVAEYHLEVAQPADMAALVHKVRNAVFRHSGKTLMREEQSGTAVWRVAT